MDQKTCFVADALRGLHSHAALWPAVRDQSAGGVQGAGAVHGLGAVGLGRGPAAAGAQPAGPADGVVQERERLRRRYGYGPKKLQGLYRQAHPGAAVPAVSTIVAGLHRQGPVRRGRPRRPRRRRTRSERRTTRASSVRGRGVLLPADSARRQQSEDTWDVWFWSRPPRRFNELEGQVAFLDPKKERRRVLPMSAE
jgi:hypothetical protein